LENPNARQHMQHGSRPTILSMPCCQPSS
jgi:hypothetical protein